MKNNLDGLLGQIVPSLQLKQQRLDAFQAIRDVIERLLPGSRVVACGSYATGTELQTRQASTGDASTYTVTLT